jgi:hypothetical protein
VRQADFLLNGRAYATAAKLAAALKKLPPPDSFYLILDQHVPLKRRAEAIAAIKTLGSKAPIITVGNEQFQ